MLICYNILYISEENLKELMENTARHMQEHKITISNLTGENVMLKNREDILNREIRGIYLYKLRYYIILNLFYLLAI